MLSLKRIQRRIVKQQYLCNQSYLFEREKLYKTHFEILKAKFSYLQIIAEYYKLIKL